MTNMATSFLQGLEVKITQIVLGLCLYFVLLSLIFTLSGRHIELLWCFSDFICIAEICVCRV